MCNDVLQYSTHYTVCNKYVSIGVLLLTNNAQLSGYYCTSVLLYSILQHY